MRTWEEKPEEMNNLKKIIGDNIKKMRKKHGIDQWELANSLGYTRSNVSMMESGKTNITIACLYKLADILHCSVFDILPEKAAADKKICLNDLRDTAFEYAEKQGFHTRKMNLGERLMLVVSELSEALEADREGKWAPKNLTGETEYGKTVTTELSDIIPESLSPETYAGEIRGTVEEEIADAVIRICDIAGVCKIDLDWHVKAKIAYNKTRPYLHGKIYG
jgi:transcriptional regulator with XRE-family HTH domain